MAGYDPSTWCFMCAAYAAVVGAGVGYFMNLGAMNGAIIGGVSALGGAILETQLASSK